MGAVQILGSVWCFTDADTTASKLIDRFSPKVREGDGLFVAELDPEKWSAWKPLGSPNDLFESASLTDQT